MLRAAPGAGAGRGELWAPRRLRWPRPDPAAGVPSSSFSLRGLGRGGVRACPGLSRPSAGHLCPPCFLTFPVGGAGVPGCRSSGVSRLCPKAGRCVRTCAGSVRKAVCGRLSCGACTLSFLCGASDSRVRACMASREGLVLPAIRQRDEACGRVRACVHACVQGQPGEARPAGQKQARAAGSRSGPPSWAQSVGPGTRHAPSTCTGARRAWNTQVAQVTKTARRAGDATLHRASLCGARARAACSLSLGTQDLTAADVSCDLTPHARLLLGEGKGL